MEANEIVDRRVWRYVEVLEEDLQQVVQRFVSGEGMLPPRATACCHVEAKRRDSSRLQVLAFHFAARDHVLLTHF